MKRLLFMTLLTAIMLQVSAQNNPPKQTPELEFALQLKVTLGQAFSIENTQHGRRTVIPITGGTFEGPGIKGTIINGGADYQLANAQGRTELEAIYCIKTDDGVYIHVRNRGIIASGKDADGKPTFYFRAAPQFEAPADQQVRLAERRTVCLRPRVLTTVPRHRPQRLESEIEHKGV